MSSTDDLAGLVEIGSERRCEDAVGELVAREGAEQREHGADGRGEHAPRLALALGGRSRPQTTAAGSSGSSTTGSPVDVDVLEDLLEERVGLVLAEVAGVHELAGEDLLGLGEHLLLAGREALDGVADGEVADHLGDLEDVARLELVAVVLVATAPVLGHLGRVAAQDLEDLVDHVRLDDLAQAGAVGVLDGDHDGHVVVEDLDREVVALLAEDLFLLDLHDLARAVMRVHDLVSD